MSHEHQLAIRMLRHSPATKAVLTWVAWHACRGCGIAWAGVELLCSETCLSDRSVRYALEELRKHDLIRVLSYGTGGRGRATEYVVVPQLVDLSTDKCEVCGKSTQTLQQPQGFVSPGVDNSEKPCNPRPENPARRAPQPSVETEPSSRARARGGRAATNGASEPRTPRTRRRDELKGLVQDLALNLSVDPPPKPRTDR